MHENTISPLICCFHQLSYCLGESVKEMAHGQSNDISTVLNYRKNLDPTTNLLKHNACPSHRKTSKKMLVKV